MAAINQSYSHLLEKAATGDISSDVLQKIEQMVHELSTRNYAMANAIQTVSIPLQMNSNVNILL